MLSSVEVARVMVSLHSNSSNEDTGEREFLENFGRNVKKCRCYGKELEIEPAYDSAVLLLDLQPKKSLHGIMCNRRDNQFRCPTANGRRKCGGLDHGLPFSFLGLLRAELQLCPPYSVCAALGMEPRALCMLGKHPTACAPCPALPSSLAPH